MVKAGAATAESLQQIQLKNKPPSERGRASHRDPDVETAMQVDDKCPRGFTAWGSRLCQGS